MTERFASYLANVLIRMGTTCEEERPFLIYGLFSIMSDIIQIGLLLLISLLLNTVVATAVFTFSFGILKRKIGGWHASRHITCLIFFTALVTFCVQISNWPDQNLVLPLTLIPAIIMVIIVWCKAPVAHPNNPQTPKRLRALKQISRRIAAGELILIIVATVLLYRTNLNRLPLTAALGGFCAALALLPKLPTTTEKGEDLI